MTSDTPAPDAPAPGTPAADAPDRASARRTVSTGDRPDLAPRRYAIPFERVWRATARALEAEGGRVEDADDTSGVVRASGETGFPRQRWAAEVRVLLDEDAQTGVEVTVHLLEGLDFGRTRRRVRRLLDRIDEAVGADEGTRIAPGSPSSPRPGAPALLLAATLVGAAACGEEPPPVPEVEESDEPVVAAEPAPPIRTYERAFAFRATDLDSTLAVVWLFESDDLGDAVQRHGRGLLLRGGAWDDFLEFDEEAPATESPWRIVPSGPLRLVVGLGDRVDHVIYDEGDRLLDLEVRGGGATWTGSRGGSFGVRDGAIVIGDRAVGGRVIDLSRAWRPAEGPPGDWVFLTSGDSIAVVLASTSRARNPEAWQGWVLRGDRETLHPRLTVEWAGTRAFDEARRDIPIAWSVTDPDGELSGSFQVRAVRVRAGTGEGPLLPVDGVFEVSGVVTLDGAERDVEGIVRHRQGDVE